MKYAPPPVGVGLLGSLPSRERGLKWYQYNSFELTRQSLPSRERGLKFVGQNVESETKIVAPFTGAWIEIPGTKLAD